MGKLGYKRVGPGGLLWQDVGAAALRWVKGPLFVRRVMEEGGWMVELSRHGMDGRVRVPLDGPFETPQEAQQAAADFFPGLRVVA